jgi:hypothetical protein
VCALEDCRRPEYARASTHRYANRAFFATALKSILASETRGGSDMQLPHVLGKQIRGGA